MNEREWGLGNMPRPKFNATAEQRKVVEGMSGVGVPEEGIAKTLGIDAKTLRKYFRCELDLGAVKASTAVAQSAFRMATSGKHPAMTMFWLKCRAGWRETAIFQHAGPGGGPVETQNIEIVISPEDARL